MTHRRVRHVCAAAIAVAALAVSPGSAGAHPAECHTALTALPTAGWPADWAPETESCSTDAPAAAGASAGTGVLAPASSTAAAAPVDRSRHATGRLRQVGHEPLMVAG